MKLLYELAFDRLACCGGIIAANNTLMIKWQKYLGMKEEGRLRQHLCQKDGSSRTCTWHAGRRIPQERAAAHEGADRGRPPRR
jgi:RimJ/RimL family protein N-acetyltransferase